jgi:hypothetical protein
MDFYNSFYDTWVTRDIDGRMFESWPPFAVNHTTQKKFAEAYELPPISSAAVIDRIEGQFIAYAHWEPRAVQTLSNAHAAAPVRCCWNGVAAIRGNLFVDRGVKFRHPRSTMWNMSRSVADCYSSECQLLCADVFRLARSETPQRAARIFVNPSVRVAYEEEHFDLYRRHWFVSTKYFFRLVSFLRFWRWPVFSARTISEEELGVHDGAPWMECVLPEDTLTISNQAGRALFGVCVFILGTLFVAVGLKGLGMFPDKRVDAVLGRIRYWLLLWGGLSGGSTGEFPAEKTQ